MPPRTYLTAPPGTEPTEATGRVADEPRERYVPGLAPATEPAVPSRWRAPLLVALVILVVVATVVTVLRVSAEQQAQDPSLMVPGLQQDGGGAPDGAGDAPPGLDGLDHGATDDPPGDPAEGQLPGDG